MVALKNDIICCQLIVSMNLNLLEHNEVNMKPHWFSVCPKSKTQYTVSGE